MSGVLLGFGVVLILMGIGAGAAAVLPRRAPEMRSGLQPVIYFVTNPALMIVLVAEAGLGEIVGVFTPIALLTAALPTAQNVFLFAGQFSLRSSLVRYVLLLSSLLGLPAVRVVALLLG